MSPQDTLRDRLAEAAGSHAPTVPVGAEVRRSAVRHRARRRVLAGSAVALGLVAVAVAGSTLLGPRPTSLGPATSPPVTTTSTPSPTTPSASAPTTPSGSTPPAATSYPATAPARPPALTRDKAVPAVAALRFPAEAAWSAAADTPVAQDDDLTWHPLACAASPITGEPLAARHVAYSLVDVSAERQVVVFGDAASASASFAELRSRMAACHADPVEEAVGDETWTTSVVGGQLGLADQAFWVGEVTRVASSDDASRVGVEQIGSVAQLLVLDGNVVSVVSSPASGPEGRTALVEKASAEWEQFRPSYDELRRP